SVRSLHARTRSTGSTRYGPHIAPAATDVVSRGGSAVQIRTRRPASARQIAVVRPDTPAPITRASTSVQLTASTVVSHRLPGERVLQLWQEVCDGPVSLTPSQLTGQGTQQRSASW